MKTKIMAVVASSLLAASSFAQTSSLNAPTALSVDEILVGESLSRDQEVAVVPLLAAFAFGALLAEAAHHHLPQQENLTLSGETSTMTTETLFDR